MDSSDEESFQSLSSEEELPSFMETD